MMDRRKTMNPRFVDFEEPAAPDMVRLLRQLADTLAELESVETGITP